MYRPGPVPENPADIPAYLRRELAYIANQMNGGENATINLSVSNVLPDKPREGDVKNFAATIAGASAGLYEYVGGSWSKL